MFWLEVVLVARRHTTKSIAVSYHGTILSEFRYVIFNLYLVFIHWAGVFVFLQR